MLHFEISSFPACHKIIFPLPPEMTQRDDIEIYARFMRYLRHVPSSRIEIKILSSIQFTADMMAYSDAHVAKLLVDMGLRAPRMAFPADFLHFADASLMRKGWEIGGPTSSLHALKEYWDNTTEGVWPEKLKPEDALKDTLHA